MALQTDVKATSTTKQRNPTGGILTCSLSLPLLNSIKPAEIDSIAALNSIRLPQSHLPSYSAAPASSTEHLMLSEESGRHCRHNISRSEISRSSSIEQNRLHNGLPCHTRSRIPTNHPGTPRAVQSRHSFPLPRIGSMPTRCERASIVISKAKLE